MAVVRVVNPTELDPPDGTTIAIHTGPATMSPRDKRVNQHSTRTSMKRKNQAQQGSSNSDAFKLQQENSKLKRQVESLQDKLEEIADVASAPKDGSAIDQDELEEKLNTILDLADPDSADEEDEDEDA